MLDRIKLDEQFMSAALDEARLAAEQGEVPVGAVVVKDGRIIARGRNARESSNLATAHAELLAIENACRALNSWRLEGCTLYVTLEPCPMCAGAIINSRVSRVVYGAADLKAGAVASVACFFHMPFNHSPAVTCGVLENACGKILADFFKGMRQ